MRRTSLQRNGKKTKKNTQKHHSLKMDRSIRWQKPRFSFHHQIRIWTVKTHDFVLLHTNYRFVNTSELCAPMRLSIINRNGLVCNQWRNERTKYICGAIFLVFAVCWCLLSAFCEAKKTEYDESIFETLMFGQRMKKLGLHWVSAIFEMNVICRMCKMHA